MALQANLKTQIDSITKKVHLAEKAATKQVQHFLKSTEKFRTHQLKNVHAIIKRAERLKATPLAKRAEEVKDQIETSASAGFQFLLSKLNVPSKSEFQRITKKVSELQKKIDELEKPARKKRK